MKKGISLFLAALLALTALAGPALGESKTYELPELYLSLDIPEEMMVFTREMAEDDIGLLVLEMTPEQLRQDFESKNVYMNAMSLDPVSYTHLDVYKRQAKRRAAPAGVYRAGPGEGAKAIASGRTHQRPGSASSI